MKSGDDCRQEHLAVQLISHFYGRRPLFNYFIYIYIYILNFILCVALCLVT